MRRFRIASGAGVFALAMLPVHAAEPDFARDAQPVFAARCAACHGAGQQMAGLRLDSGAGVMKGAHSGVVITPGDPAKSRLLERITSSKPGFKMPPTGAPLSDAEIATVRAWIESGAKAPLDASAPVQAAKSSHWSFQPIRK